MDLVTITLATDRRHLIFLCCYFLGDSTDPEQDERVVKLSLKNHIDLYKMLTDEEKKAVQVVEEMLREKTPKELAQIIAQRFKEMGEGL